LGPEIEDFRDQHLHSDPPALTSGPIALRGIVGECLYKAPGARPSPANLLERLRRAAKGPGSGGLGRLQEANLAEIARRSESDRLASEGRSAAERRAALFKGAAEGCKVIRDTLVDAITSAAPTVSRTLGKRGGVALMLGRAEIEIFPIAQTPVNPWEWQAPAFDVVAHAGIIVRIPSDRYGYEGRSHSLWFCDAREATRYQWFETAFMFTPMIPRTSRINPFLADPGPEAAKALWVGLSEFQLAWPLEPLNLGDLDEFIDRWANWFAEAADGRLRSPSTMPERDTPRDWRQK
jgi:hypothetical protein